MMEAEKRNNPFDDDPDWEDEAINFNNKHFDQKKNPQEDPLIEACYIIDGLLNYIEEHI